MLESYDFLEDVVIHHVKVHSGSGEHTVSVEMYTVTGDIIFKNLPFIVQDNSITIPDLQLTEK